MTPLQKVDSSMRAISHLTGPTSLLGLLVILIFDSRSTVAKGDFEMLRNSVMQIEKEQAQAQIEYANIFRELQQANFKLNSLLRLVCTTNKDKALSQASGAC